MGARAGGRLRGPPGGAQGCVVAPGAASGCGRSFSLAGKELGNAFFVAQLQPPVRWLGVTPSHLTMRWG